MSATSNIPEKPYFRVNEVCQLTDTQPYVLRFWESEFPQLNPDHSSGGAAVYKKNDVELIFRIKTLLYEEEYTIAGARQVLSEEGGKPATRQARSARPAVEPEAPTEVEEPAAEPPRPRQLELDTPPIERPTAVEAAGGMAGTPGIDRDRYEDALEEINHLRLKLSEIENRARRAEHEVQDAVNESERLRDRHDRAIGRLESILQQLTS